MPIIADWLQREVLTAETPAELQAAVTAAETFGVDLSPGALTAEMQHMADPGTLAKPGVAPVLATVASWIPVVGPALSLAIMKTASDEKKDAIESVQQALAAQQQVSLALAAEQRATQPPQATNMDDYSSGSSSFWPDLSSVNWGGVFDTGLGVLNNVLAIKAASAQRPPPAVAAAAAPEVMPVGFPSLPAIGGMVGRALGLGASTAVRAAAGVVRSAAGAIRGVVLASGKFISRPKAVALAKRLGLEGAAVALGITTVELAQMVVEDSAHKRHMNPLNIRAARRAIRRIRAVRNVTASIERQVTRALPPRARARFTRGSPGVITRREAARALRR